MTPQTESIPEFNSPKNWVEDFNLENGNYICTCLICDHQFFGYKRRIICKECFDSEQSIDLII